MKEKKKHIANTSLQTRKHASRTHTILTFNDLSHFHRKHCGSKKWCGAWNLKWSREYRMEWSAMLQVKDDIFRSPRRFPNECLPTINYYPALYFMRSFVMHPKTQNSFAKWMNFIS